MDYIEVTDEMMDEYWCVREESVSNEIARDAIRAAIAASPLYKRVQELEASVSVANLHILWETIERKDEEIKQLRAEVQQLREAKRELAEALELALYGNNSKQKAVEALAKHGGGQ